MSKSRRDISIVVDNEYEDQDELTRDYRHGGNSLMNSMREVSGDQDQIYNGKSHLNSTRNRAGTKKLMRNSTNLDMQSRFDNDQLNAQADSKQL